MFEVLGSVRVSGWGKVRVLGLGTRANYPGKTNIALMYGLLIPYCGISDILVMILIFLFEIKLFYFINLMFYRLWHSAELECC